MRNDSSAKLPLDPLRHTIAEAALLLGISRAQVYRRLQSGELSAQKDGASVFILPAELRRYVESRTATYEPNPDIKKMAIRTAPQRMAARARKRSAA